MSRRSKEIHEIETFMDGIASVCDDPHAPFSMPFRGDTFCEGFVFDIKDLKA